jgi:hypothetical protein
MCDTHDSSPIVPPALLRMPTMCVHLSPCGQVDEGKTIFYDERTRTFLNGVMIPIQFIESYLLEPEFVVPVCTWDTNGIPLHSQVFVTKTSIERFGHRGVGQLDTYIGQVLQGWCRHERTIANIHRVYNRTYRPASMLHLNYVSPS